MENRTNNAVRNVYSAVIFQILNIVIKFGMRTVFVYCLGQEYLGVSGVFSNVLTILSLTELGLGTAIVYDMYKPIAEGDTHKITQLVVFYKQVYAAIGIIVFIAGSVLIPFLNVILTEVPNVSHLTLIYVLFLVKTSSSYFFAQYTTVLSAYQKNYINTKYRMVFSVIKAVSESVLLLCTGQYLLYLVLDIILEIICSYCIYKNAVRLFPYIKEKTAPLENAEIKKIWKNAMDMFSIKIGTTFVNATDNVIISAFVSTVLVGIYSNYGLIIQIILTSTILIQNAVIAGVGNVCVSNDTKKKSELFEKINFMYASIFSLIFGELVVLLQPFIVLWLGNEYRLEMPVVVIAILNCYLSGMHQPVEMYIYADGMFRYFKWKPWIEVFLNLVISILLAQKLGMIGVFLGTTISCLLTTFWYDAYIVYRYSLKKDFKRYWIRYVQYFGVTVLICIVTMIFAGKIEGMASGIVLLLLKGTAALVICGCIWGLFFMHTKEYRYFFDLLREKIKVKTGSRK